MALQFDRESAKKAGYSDSEIDAFLKQQEKPTPLPTIAAPSPKPAQIDRSAAKKAGYSDKEITDFENKAQPKIVGNKVVYNESPDKTQSYGQQSDYDVYSGNVSPASEYATPPNTPLSVPKGNWRVDSTFDQATPNSGQIGNFDNQGWGNNVTVTNTDTGEKLSFNHLNQVGVKPGDALTEGQPIGLSGHTGNSLGPHVAIQYTDSQGTQKDLKDSPYGDFVTVPKSIDIPKPETAPTPQQPTQAPTISPNVPAPASEQPAPDQPTPTDQDPQIEGLIQQAPQDKQDHMRAVAASLKDNGILNPNTMAYAMATIGHETAGAFSPVEEINGPQQAASLGYDGGTNYYGRGDIQLTGRGNYDTMGKRIGVTDLADHPEKALDPNVSAKVVGAFFKDRGVADLASKGDFIGARGPINGTDQAQKIADQTQAYLDTAKNYTPKQVIPKNVTKPQAQKPQFNPLTYFHDILYHK